MTMEKTALQALLKRANYLNSLHKKAESLETADTEASELKQTDTGVETPREGSFSREWSNDIKKNVPNSVEDNGNEPATSVPNVVNEEKSEAGENEIPTTETFKEPGQYYGSQTGDSELKVGKQGAAIWLNSINKTAADATRLLTEITEAVDSLKNAQAPAEIKTANSKSAGEMAAVSDFDKQAVDAINQRGFEITVNAVHTGFAVGDKVAQLLKAAEEDDEEESAVPEESEDDTEGSDIPLTDVGGEEAMAGALGEGENDEYARELMADDGGDETGGDPVEEIMEVIQENPELAALIEENPEILAELIGASEGDEEALESPDGDEGVMVGAPAGGEDEDITALLSQLEDTGGGPEEAGMAIGAPELPKMGSAKTAADKNKSARAKKALDTIREKISRGKRI